MAIRRPGCDYPITVLFIVPTMVAGGAERQLVELARNMDRRRFRPIICCQKYTGEFFDLAKQSGAECFLLGCEPRFDLRFPIRLWKLIRSEGVRVLVTRGLSVHGIGSVVGTLAGVEAIVKAEHSTGEIGMGWGRKMVEKLFIPLGRRGKQGGHRNWAKEGVLQRSLTRCLGIVQLKNSKAFNLTFGLL